MTPVKRPGLRYITGIERGSKITPYLGGVLVVHPSHPPRWIKEDGTIVEITPEHEKDDKITS